MQNISSSVKKVHDSTSQEIATVFIKKQHEALLELLHSIDSNFHNVVEFILSMKGHLIVSGMGKSGHIGRKISATLASTGQPSFFIHPSEACHGDLGMITSEDALLLLSNSGETSEILPLLEYAHRFHIKTICITKNANSTMAKLSTYSLILPDIEEACPLNLAPTTSSTLTLVLGDTLAVTLLKKRGFTNHDFKQFHPKGNLGAQLQTVQDIMHGVESLPLVPLKISMKEAIVCMSSKGFGCVGIIDTHQKLQGIITDGDLRRHMHDNLLQKTVDDVMTKSPVVIYKDQLVSDILAIMQERSITSLFVIDSRECVVGLVHIHDCLRVKAI